MGDVVLNMVPNHALLSRHTSFVSLLFLYMPLYFGGMVVTFFEFYLIYRKWKIVYISRVTCRVLMYVQTIQSLNQEKHIYDP